MPRRRQYRRASSSAKQQKTTRAGSAWDAIQAATALTVREREEAREFGQFVDRGVPVMIAASSV